MVSSFNSTLEVIHISKHVFFFFLRLHITPFVKKEGEKRTLYIFTCMSIKYLWQESQEIDSFGFPNKQDP